jgi:hypothetical protein
LAAIGHPMCGITLDRRIMSVILDMAATGAIARRTIGHRTLPSGLFIDRPRLTRDIVRRTIRDIVRQTISRVIVRRPIGLEPILLAIRATGLERTRRAIGLAMEASQAHSRFVRGLQALDQQRRLTGLVLRRVGQVLNRRDRLPRPGLQHHRRGLHRKINQRHPRPGLRRRVVRQHPRPSRRHRIVHLTKANQRHNSGRSPAGQSRKHAVAAIRGFAESSSL